MGPMQSCSREPQGPGRKSLWDFAGEFLGPCRSSPFLVGGAYWVCRKVQWSLVGESYETIYNMITTGNIITLILCVLLIVLVSRVNGSNGNLFARASGTRSDEPVRLCRGAFGTRRKSPFLVGGAYWARRKIQWSLVGESSIFSFLAISAQT